MFKHLKETNQKYLAHAEFGLTAAGWLLIASIASFIHALWPTILPFAAERITKRLADTSQERQRRRSENANNQIS